MVKERRNNIIKVSVIIPIYNVEPYLEQCLESVINQSYPSIEIICINDGSTDNSATIVKNFAENNKNILIVNQNNSGLSASRNIGIKISTGDYLFFLDSDDYLYNEFVIEELINEAMNNDLDIIAGAFIEIYSNKINDVKHVLYDDSIINDCTSGITLFEKGVQTNSLSSVVWNKLYKKDLIAGELFLEGYYFEDMEYTIRVLLKAKKVKFINKRIVNYRKRKNSITTNLYSKKKAEDYLNIANCIAHINNGNSYISNWIAVCVIKAIKISLRLNQTDRKQIFLQLKKNPYLQGELQNSNKYKHKFLGKGITLLIP